jgi:hypothetical protein
MRYYLRTLDLTLHSAIQTPQPVRYEIVGARAYRIPTLHPKLASGWGLPAHGLTRVVTVPLRGPFGGWVLRLSASIYREMSLLAVVMPLPVPAPVSAVRHSTFFWDFCPRCGTPGRFAVFQGLDNGG